MIYCIIIVIFLLIDKTVNYIKDKEAFVYETSKNFENYIESTQQVLIDCFPNDFDKGNENKLY